jgi:signal transduction histidine kinase
MPALKLFNQPDGSLIADYASRMSEVLARQQTEIEVRAARMEADLAIKARSEFLANMNHELRTPLNAIMGFATMLRDGEQYTLSDEQHTAYAEYILQSADLLLGHINTILEVAALESGSVELRNDAVDFCEVLDGAIERARVRADAAEVTIERRDEGAEINGWGDAERTGQAVDHLLQTAISLSAEKGRILVRACFDDHGRAEIAVRDDGAGLSPEEIKQALEAFAEPHRGLDRSFAGPGVGYAVAKTFIEMQGGAFHIKSRKGHGTLVRIALPPPGAKANPASDEDGAAQPEKPSLEKPDDAA